MLRREHTCSRLSKSVPGACVNANLILCKNVLLLSDSVHVNSQAKSKRLGTQEFVGVGLHGPPLRSMLLRMVRSFPMQAVSATFLGLIVESNRR